MTGLLRPAQSRRSIDAIDNCQAVANADQADADQDRVGDACDNCPNRWNRDQADGDDDDVGDRCDTGNDNGAPGNDNGVPDNDNSANNDNGNGATANDDADDPGSANPPESTAVCPATAATMLALMLYGLIRHHGASEPRP